MGCLVSCGAEEWVSYPARQREQPAVIHVMSHQPFVYSASCHVAPANQLSLDKLLASTD